MNIQNLCHFYPLDKSYHLGNHFTDCFAFCVTFCLCIREFFNEAAVVKSVKVVVESLAVRLIFFIILTSSILEPAIVLYYIKYLSHFRM